MKPFALLLAAWLALAAPAPRHDGWRILGPGGGGAQFIPTISPHDTGTVLIACDMTGNYITHDAGASWRMFNLGEPVRFFVFDPKDARVIYAQSAALFRSADGGETWRMLLPRPEAIRKITMGDDHAGATIHVSHVPDVPRGQVKALAIDPDDSRLLYLATGDQAKSTLWNSPDWGATWRRGADLPGGAREIWIDPHSLKSERTLYIAGARTVSIREQGRWRTGESPGAFAAIAAGFPASGPPVFYATVAGRIFVSADGGMKWKASSLPGFQGQAGAIATARGNPDVAYVSYNGLRAPIRMSLGVAKTTDRGRHWELVWQDSRTPAQNVHGAWVSERFNPGWAGNPLGLGVAPNNPEICYSTDYGRTMRTTDGGKNWHSVYSIRTPDGNWTTNGIDVTTSYGVHFDPFDPRRIFVTHSDIGLFASDTGGESWYSATRTGVPPEWTNTTYWIAFDPKVRGRIWAAMSGTHDLPRPKMWTRPANYNGGVARSDDGGRTWQVANSGMPQTAATHILLDPASPESARVLYVTGFGRGVFKSTDGGLHWASKNAGLEGGQPFAWRMARDSRGALYLVVARRSDDGGFGNSGDGALYRSTDGAEHWTRLRLPEGVNGPNGLAIDQRDPARLYLAAWGRSTPEGAQDGGIFLSTDAGARWRNVLAKDQHIYDVTTDPKDGRVLYAAGFESSAWRSSDRGLTWRRLPGFDFKWGHRVIPDPLDSALVYITTFGGGVWHGPWGKAGGPPY